MSCSDQTWPTSRSLSNWVYRHISDIISLIERNTGQCDFIQFRLDWLYYAVVRYCDNIPSGEAVMVLIQEATELLRQSEGDGFSQNLSFQAEFTATGERGRINYRSAGKYTRPRTARTFLLTRPQSTCRT